MPSAKPIAGQPDDPGPHDGDDVFGPRVFVEVTPDRAPNLIATIRKSLKRGMNPLKLAADIGLPFGRFKRVAQAAHIPLPREREPEPMGS